MSLDTEDIKLITGLQKDMEERIVDAIKGQGTGMRAKIESEVNRIDEMDKIRNGKIRCNEEEVEELQRETRFSRFAQKNAGKMIVGFIIIVALISLGTQRVNVKRTIEKLLPIELNDDSQ